MKRERHERVVLGVELEAYTISTPDFKITRQMAFPRKGLGEKGERFARDSSIGTEYNSRPFSTIREGLFLLKAGLRKYSRSLYGSRQATRKSRQLLLVGGWRDRFAGTHIHLSIADREFTKDDARRLAWHLHDHIPLLIALGANSPVWADEITPFASNRVARASRIYFKPVPRGVLTQRTYDEILYSRGRLRKPATLEIRVMDSNIPEFVMAAAVVIKVVALNWLLRGKAQNRIRKADYLLARQDAAERGMRARLCWNGDWVSAVRYLDLFVWNHRHLLDELDIPEDLWSTFMLLKRRLDGAAILRTAARAAYREHPSIWQELFARRYVDALDHLLSGNSIETFVEKLHVPVPDLDQVWLGRRNLKLW